jgi:hypothetical protein
MGWIRFVFDHKSPAPPAGNAHGLNGRKLALKASFKLVDPGSVTDEQLETFPDRNIHQTGPWVKFLAQSLGAQAVVAELKEGNHTLGYFTGLMTKEFGFKILGSPFPGWSTTFMGFNLLPNVPRATALEALTQLAFRDLKCHHLEVMDRRLTHEDAERLGFQIWDYRTFEVDLSLSEEEIFGRMKHQCRNCIRKAKRSGVVIEEARDAEFADEYYQQLQHVFAVKGLPAPFPVERVRNLLKFLLPTGRLLLLRAFNSNGSCIATGIFPAMNKTMYAWGSASWRKYSNVRPNEAIFWYAMKYWKRRGMLTCDLVGAVDYKTKYGGNPVTVPWLRKSRNQAVAALRTTAETMILRHPQSVGRVYTLIKDLLGRAGGARHAIK